MLKVALEGFAQPLTELFRGVDKQVTDALAAGQSLTSHRASFTALLSCLRLCTGIFHCLNWIDLPEYFEDNISEWMGHFHRYLALAEPRVKSQDDDTDEGPLEALQAAILVSQPAASQPASQPAIAARPVVGYIIYQCV